MAQHKQVFQTATRLRWRLSQFAFYGVLAFVAAMAGLLVYSMATNKLPVLPTLMAPDGIRHLLAAPAQPHGLDKADQARYKGFQKVLAANSNHQPPPAAGAKPGATPVRAAFYVDWDPQAFYSLQKNIGKLNMVLPEWLFIDPAADTLYTRIDQAALALMRQHHMAIVPMLSNVNERDANGDFDGKLLARVVTNPAKRNRLVRDLAKVLHQYHFQGINIDFEEWGGADAEPLQAFQQQVYETLHPQGMLVTQAVAPGNEDDLRRLGAHNDLLFLMAYDEHYSTSAPGPVSSQKWIEKVVDQAAGQLPAAKIVVCLAAYGYDWPARSEAATLSYQEAIARAAQYGATVSFNNDTYNNQFAYTGGDGVLHQVQFADAATAFNVMRFADEYGTAGTALWRLGSEDERVWAFYNRNLSNAALRKDPFRFQELTRVQQESERPDYMGDGEVLNVLAAPTTGKLHLTINPVEQVISEQNYLQLPTRYVIKKYGVVHHQVVLTFDDGPDPVYTPQILDILKKEQVPAAFFVVGMEAENNLPLLHRIIAEGHEIGNHSYTHPNMAEISGQRAVMEMEATRLLISAATGRSTVLFRAPYNADAEPSTQTELKPVWLSRQQNYYTVGESIDPNDWETAITADSIYQRTVRQYLAHPDKGIILLHDAGGNRQATVAALPAIIRFFKQRGIAFISIAQLLHTTHATVMPPSAGSLMDVDGRLFTAGYWFQHGLAFLFALAIALGIARTLLLGVMALRNQRRIKASPGVAMADAQLPAVSIIVPAFNEALNAVRTIQSLLQQQYPHFNIVFVDDGSTDATTQLVSAAYNSHPRVQLLRKTNGGKASALNYGIAHAATDYVVCIDADTQLHPGALRQLMCRMLTPDPAGMPMGAVAGNVKVGNLRNLLTRWQSIEYTTAQNFDRLALDLVNAITVVPGAIGAFSKQAIQAAGGFTSDTLAEDCDLTIRLLRQGYRVANCTTAVAVTEAPEGLGQFMKQRFRWSYGVMQAFWKNRDACFRPRYKALGMIALPNILVFQIILPLLAPLADLLLITSLIWNRQQPANLMHIGGFYVLFLLVDLVAGYVAFSFEKEKISRLLWLIPQRFCYRQLMYVVLFRALKKAVKGEGQGWGVLKRTGNVAQVAAS